MSIERSGENRFPVIETVLLDTGSRGITIEPTKINSKDETFKTTDGELPIPAGAKIAGIHFTPEGKTTSERLANGYLGLKTYFKHLETAKPDDAPDYFIGVTPVDKLADLAINFGFQDIKLGCEEPHRHVMANIQDVKSHIDSIDPNTISNLISRATRQNPAFNTNDELNIAKIKVNFKSLTEQSSKHAKLGVVQLGTTISLLASYLTFCIYNNKPFYVTAGGDAAIVIGTNVAGEFARRKLRKNFKRDMDNAISLEITSINNPNQETK